MSLMKMKGDILRGVLSRKLRFFYKTFGEDESKQWKETEEVRSANSEYEWIYDYE